MPTWQGTDCGSSRAGSAISWARHVGAAPTTSSLVARTARVWRRRTTTSLELVARAKGSYSLVLACRELLPASAFGLPPRPRARTRERARARHVSPFYARRSALNEADGLSPVIHGSRLSARPFCSGRTASKKHSKPAIEPSNFGRSTSLACTNGPPCLRSWGARRKPSNRCVPRSTAWRPGSSAGSWAHRGTVSNIRRPIVPFERALDLLRRCASPSSSRPWSRSVSMPHTCALATTWRASSPSRSIRHTIKASQSACERAKPWRAGSAWACRGCARST